MESKYLGQYRDGRSAWGLVAHCEQKLLTTITQKFYHRKQVLWDDRSTCRSLSGVKR